MPNLLIIRGAPGSGKSTIANALCVGPGLFDFWFEADHWMTDLDGCYKFNPKRLEECHNECFKAVARSLSKGWNTIVSNTNLEQWQFERYVKLADEKGYPLQFMILDSHDFKNTHGVSEDKVNKMKNKLLKDVIDNQSFGYQ